MLVKNINYVTSSDFTFDSDLVEFTGSNATLKLQSGSAQTFNQGFSSSSGFTFDSDKTAITGGSLSQLGGGLAGANYSTDADFNWGSGTLTATLGASATVSGGKLDLTAGYVEYVGTGKINADHGTIKFKYTPDYSDDPPGITTMFNYQRASGDSDNRLWIYHDTSGNILMDSKAFNGLNITASTTFVTNWQPVADTEYEIAVVWDFSSASGHKIFIDGVLSGTIDATGTRDDDLTSIAFLQMGRAETFNSFNHSVDDLVIFDTLEYSTTYTPGYAVGDNQYSSDLISLPQFSAAADVTAWGAFTPSSVTGSLNYILNDQYHNGSAWVASDGSLAQSNTAAEVSSNIATLPFTQTLDVDIRTEDSSTQGSIGDLTIGFTAPTYSTTDPTILNNTSFNTDAISAVTFDETTSANTAVKYTLVIDDQDKYWNGSAWVNSDGTYAQANTGAEINTNAPALTWDDDGNSVKVRAFLHTDTDLETPTLTQVSIAYDFAPGAISTPDTTIVYGYLCEADIDPRSAVSLVFDPLSSVSASSYLLSSGVTETTSSNLSGYFELSLIPGRYNVTIGSDAAKEVLIPDQESFNINEQLGI